MQMSTPTSTLSRFASRIAHLVPGLLLASALVVGGATGASPAAEPEAPTTPAGEPFIPEDMWQEPAPVSRDSELDMAGTAGRMALTLVMLIACLVGGLVLLKRWKRGRQLLHPSRHLEMIESLPLGMKRSLVLVRLGDQVLVVGQTDQQVSHVATVPATVLAASEQGRGTEGDTAAATLPEAGEAGTTARPPAATAEAGTDKLGRFQEKLQALLGGRS